MGDTVWCQRLGIGRSAALLLRISKAMEMMVFMATKDHLLSLNPLWYPNFPCLAFVQSGKDNGFDELVSPKMVLTVTDEETWVLAS